ncbi:MAG TPA: TonB-dependent receptor [Thermoanaerobaculia bacterium]|nr:TonB-dependent receptor [Thermoanaerobaculia bacterium]
MPLLAFVAAAAVSVYRLLDSTGEPVRGASVRIVGGETRAVTDAEGRFRLDPGPTPPFDLVVFGAHGALIGSARVESASTRIVVLQALGAESVTVRGSPLPATSPSPAAAATEISRETLENERPVLLSDAVAEVPGGSNAGGGHTGVPSLRGMARGRTLLLLDDARVTAERRAGPSAGFLDPSALDSVEVVRGPGSLAYGPDGLGGVIHARTPEPRLGEPGGRAQATFGSADESAGFLVEQNVPIGRGAVFVQAHARTFGDYESPDGVVPDSAARDRGVLFRGLLSAGQARLGLGFRSDRARDVGRPVRAGLSERTFYPEEVSDRLTLSADIPDLAGSDVVEVRGFVGRYRLVTARESISAAGRSIEEAAVEANDASFRLVGSKRHAAGAVRFGFDGHARFDLEADTERRQLGPSGELVSRDTEDSIDDARRVGGGVFLEAERSFASDRLHFVAGLRGDAVHSRNRGGFFGDRETSHGALSALVAMTLRPAEAFDATLQYVRGFREPTLSDRYFRGVSGRGFVVGNPDLRPERSDQFDLALRAAFSERARIAAYGYLYRIHDVVERFRSDEDFHFRNRGDQEVRGAELEAEWSPTDRLELGAGLTWARGRMLDDDSSAADVPARSAVVTARYSATRRLWLRLRARLVARDDEPGPTEVSTPAHEIVDLGGGFSVAKGFEAVLLGSNLLDERYPLSSDADAPQAPGRGVALTLQARW